MHPKSSALDLFFSELHFVSDEDLLYFDFNPSHFEDVIFLKHVVLAVTTKLVIADHVVHALLHFEWRQQWISSFMILVVNVFNLVDWVEAFNEKLISHLGYA